MTLLSIVGEDISRIIPLLYAYRHKIKHHVLLCDDDISNHNRAKTLKKGMMRFSAQHNLGWYTHIATTDEDSASQIEIVAKKQFQYQGELWLNATDGYPAMTILLSDLVRAEGGCILSYDHFDNDLHIIQADGTMETNQLDESIDIDSYLTLLNYTVVEKQTVSSLQPRKKDIMSLYKNEKLFTKTRKLLLYNHFNRKEELLINPEIKQALLNLHVITRNNQLITSQQKVLQGDIFEEYIFWLCQMLSPDDIALGVKIDFDDASKEPESKNRVYNEFDILLTHNNRMYTVECKFSKNLEGLEFVYKYDAIIDYFGKSSKAIIANISSTPKEKYIGSKASRSFRHSTLRRARMAGVAIYHESVVDVIKFQNLVRNFFHIK